MTDPQDSERLSRMDSASDEALVTQSSEEPDGVTVEYREITDDDLATVGTDRTTMGEATGGIDDLDDDLDDDLTALDNPAEP